MKKLIIVMRRDLNLPAGKAIAQGAHAALWALQAVKDFGDETLAQEWEQEGCPKIVLGVDSEAEIYALVDRLRDAGLIPRLVRDFGRTIVEPNTLTCLGVGPADAADLDPITGSLKKY
jgi:PTH2 family peptidyl-tRNA hydrolase